ncbi:hypothetical protein ACRYCC_24480 [Actinomadura scrupuli]|uniref:hypothetical protein n=1 Tax=Actinomadura scrupuli TaxID=559629 RepID=UPI003D98D601
MRLPEMPELRRAEAAGREALDDGRPATGGRALLGDGAGDQGGGSPGRRLPARGQDLA